MKRNNISKNNILKDIKHHQGLPISFSEKIFDLIFDIIIEGLKRDNRLKIAGFGTYKVAKRKARIGRNPRTGEQIQIAASQKVKFLPAKALKEIFNK